MAEQTASLPINLDVFTRLSPRQKLGAMLAVAFAIALLVGAWLWTREPPYSVLFSNLSERDGGQIVTALQQQNIPYSFSDGGGAILVPASRVHDVRLRLAAQGLPKGGQVGFELMENLKLGSTQFAEQIAYQRGLEGELGRTISSLAAVQGARVHLAIPKQTSFLRDEQKPSASVVVSLHPGRVLEPAQAAGIVNLVASSVPQLAPAQVSIIDQNGNLLSQPSDSLKNAGLDPTQIKFVRELEREYIARVEAILAPMVGATNVKAQVAADVDFSQTDQVAETFRPNPSPEGAIRSQQTAESSSTTAGAIGVPGALTNQPPVPATAPLTTPPAGGAAPPGTANATIALNAPVNFNKNATINYEVDKTIKHTKGAPGVVRRLSVGVVVNHKKGPEKDGKAGKPVPLSETELKQVTALVREAVGFSQERGDSVNVANVPFAAQEREIVPEMPIWKNPDLLALLREAAKYLAFGVVVYLLWTKVFKALFEMFAAAAKRIEMEEQAKAEEVQEAASGHRGPTYDVKLQQARDLAKQDPKLVANVIKEWVGGNESR
ncbi:MAG: flagellar M-ring protein FliF [Rhodocyclales bacterium]|nr:flagellar M-ring protein FliF [Rhodocyclales bacterium]